MGHQCRAGNNSICRQHGDACLSKTSVSTEARCTDACCVSRTACVRLMQGRSSFLFTGNTSPSQVTTSSIVALLSAFTLCLHRDRALSIEDQAVSWHLLEARPQPWLLIAETQDVV